MIDPVDAKINDVAGDQLGVFAGDTSYRSLYRPVCDSVVAGYQEINKAIRREMMRT